MLQQKINVSINGIDIYKSQGTKQISCDSAEILRCVKIMIIMKNVSLLQLNVRKYDTLGLRGDSSDQRDEKEFLILGRLFEKDVGQAVNRSQTS